jgi:hypothetical protein
VLQTEEVTGGLQLTSSTVEIGRVEAACVAKAIMRAYF